MTWSLTSSLIKKNRGSDEEFVAILAAPNSRGNITDRPNMVESIITTSVIVQSIVFCTGVLAWSPINCRSFRISIMKISDAGSSVIATTCTNSVISTSGARGISTTAPEVCQNQEVGDVEPRRLAHFPVQGMRPAEDLADCPGTGQRQADCAKQSGIEQPYGKQHPATRPPTGVTICAACAASVMIIGSGR